MASFSRSEGQTGRWWREPEILLLVVLVGVSQVGRLADLTTRGEESRRGTVAMEMLRTGDWLAPRQQGEYYFSRPPLQNWLIAVAAQLHGNCDNWAIRLPSALATLLTGILIYGYTRSFLSRLGAFTAAAAFLSMALVLQMGGTGETDALFTLFVGGALLTWHWGWSRDWPSAWMWMAAYVFVALGALTKGPQAPVYFAASVGLFLLLARKLRALFDWGHVLGLLTFALIFGAWFVPYSLRVGADGAWRILGDQAASRYLMDNPGRMAQHLVWFPPEMFGSLLPWSLCLLAYLRRSFRNTIGAAAPNVCFLVTCLAATFPSVWLAQEAQVRYWMPLVPCWAPLVGLVIQRAADAPAGSRLRRWWTWFVTGLTLAAVCVPVVALAGGTVESWTGWPLRQPSLPLTLTFALAVVATAVLALRQRRRFEPARVGLAVFAVAASLALSFSGWYVNILANRSLDAEGAVAQVKREIGDNRLVSFGFVNHLFPYYYRDHIPPLKWPTTEQDVPEGLTYFCFDADFRDGPNLTPPRPLPFTWEVVAVINCDRNSRPRPEVVVVIARRIPGP